MKLVLSLLKNGCSEYKKELKGFANYCDDIVGNCDYYLKIYKNLSGKRKEKMKAIMNKISTLANNIRSISGN